MIATNNGWISIDDALPPKDKRVLLLFKIKDDSEGSIIFRTTEELQEFTKKGANLVEIMTVERFMEENGDNYSITHWMPIPRLSDRGKEFL